MGTVLTYMYIGDTPTLNGKRPGCIELCMRLRWCDAFRYKMARSKDSITVDILPNDLIISQSGDVAQRYMNSVKAYRSLKNNVIFFPSLVRNRQKCQKPGRNMFLNK